MAKAALTIGDVVKWHGSLHVIAGLQSDRAALCPVLPTRTVRHRADILIEFPDTLHLGLVDGAPDPVQAFRVPQCWQADERRLPAPRPAPPRSSRHYARDKCEAC